jgi:hypothetical protein
MKVRARCAFPYDLGTSPGRRPQEFAHLEVYLGLAKDHRELRTRSDPPTVPARTTNGNPKRLPRNIRNTSDANPRPCRHLIGTVPPPTKPRPVSRPAPRIGIPNAASPPLPSES